MASLLAIPFPVIDPIALQIGPVAIRWYALAYVAGILLGWAIIRRLNARQDPPRLSKQALEDMILYAVIGIVAGGRLGYALFYHLPYFLHHPGDILMVWRGGMSFHGGLLGVLISFYFFARKYKVPYLAVMDLLAAVTPIGLGLGRLANFINGELYGRAADVPWAMVFPRGGPNPRHPSQLYEAALEGALLLALLLFLARKPERFSRPGLIGGVFMLGYGVARFVSEFFREPDLHLGVLSPGMTMGQLLCLPMAAIGVWLIWTRTRPANTQRP